MIVVVLAAFTAGCFSRGSEILDQWEGTNGTFKIRVLTYDERFGQFPPRVIGVFETLSPESHEWQEIMDVRLKSHVEDPRERVRYLTDQIAYVFMWYKFAVTLNAGRTWTVTDLFDDRTAVGLDYNSPYIRGVAMSPQGIGEMIVIETRRIPAVEFSEDLHKIVLHTRDCGQHWRAAPLAVQQYAPK